MSKCTKCNKELASDHRGKKCDNCKNRIFERIRKTGEVIGMAALVVIAVASRPAEDEERDDEDDF
jgi:hypothetical protein